MPKKWTNIRICVSVLGQRSAMTLIVPLSWTNVNSKTYIAKLHRNNLVAVFCINKIWPQHAVRHAWSLLFSHRNTNIFLWFGLIQSMCSKEKDMLLDGFILHGWRCLPNTFRKQHLEGRMCHTSSLSISDTYVYICLMYKKPGM